MNSNDISKTQQLMKINEKSIGIQTWHCTARLCSKQYIFPSLTLVGHTKT